MPGLPLPRHCALAGGRSAGGYSCGNGTPAVEPRGIAFDAIDFAGLRGKGAKTLLLGGFYLLRALWQSRALIRARKPRVMFRPVAMSQFLPNGGEPLGVPLVLRTRTRAADVHQDAESLASAVLCGFDGAAAERG